MRLSGRLARLLRDYVAVILLALAAHAGLFYLTGVRNQDTTVWIYRTLMVDHGKVYHSLYTGQLLWHVAAVLLAVTVWHLKSEAPLAGGRLAWFLLSPRVNMIAGIAFIFGTLGLYDKGGPLTDLDEIYVADAVFVLLVVLRVIVREIYRATQKFGRSRGAPHPDR